LGTTVTNQNYIHEKVEIRLNWVVLAIIQLKTFYVPVLKLKIEIYRTVILSVADTAVKLDLSS